jgi:hypothetical protein
VFLRTLSVKVVHYANELAMRSGRTVLRGKDQGRPEPRFTVARGSLEAVSKQKAMMMATRGLADLKICSTSDPTVSYSNDVDRFTSALVY